jgi:Branched-chain amino acid aminotransferase/4-amino-4-deoxychorismate lyase
LKRLSEEGFKVLEKEVRIEDLNKADEIWVTSSTKEIQPVHQVDNKVLPTKELEEYYWHKALKILEEDLKSNC